MRDNSVEFISIQCRANRPLIPSSDPDDANAGARRVGYIEDLNPPVCSPLAQRLHNSIDVAEHRQMNLLKKRFGLSVKMGQPISASTFTSDVFRRMDPLSDGEVHQSILQSDIPGISNNSAAALPEVLTDVATTVRCDGRHLALIFPSDEVANTAGQLAAMDAACRNAPGGVPAFARLPRRFCSAAVTAERARSNQHVYWSAGV